jgi:septal ring factor EnvC (AmiA/AmiB activator)
LAAVNTEDGNKTNNPKPSYEDLINEIKSLQTENTTLQAKIKISEAANKEIQEANKTLATRVEAIELESRKDKIASIVRGAYDESTIDERVQDLVKSNLPLDKISEIVAPLIKAANSDTKHHKTKQAAATMVTGTGSTNNLEYSSTVAIKNAQEESSNKTKPAWAQNYVDLIHGGGNG